MAAGLFSAASEQAGTSQGGTDAKQAKQAGCQDSMPFELGQRQYLAPSAVGALPFGLSQPEPAGWHNRAQGAEVEAGEPMEVPVTTAGPAESFRPEAELDAQALHADGINSWVQLLHRSYLSGGPPPIPSSFWVRHIPHTDWWSLMNVAGSTWPIKITRRHKGATERVEITTGWKRFAVDNGLAVRNVVHFALVAPQVLRCVLVSRGPAASPSEGPVTGPAAGVRAAEGISASSWEGGRQRQARSSVSPALTSPEPSTADGDMAETDGSDVEVPISPTVSPKRPRSKKLFKGRNNGLGNFLERSLFRYGGHEEMETIGEENMDLGSSEWAGYAEGNQRSPFSRRVRQRKQPSPARSPLS